MARIVIDCRSVHHSPGGIGRYASELLAALARARSPHAMVGFYGRSLPEGYQPPTEAVSADAAMIDPAWEQLQLPGELDGLGADLFHGTCFAVPIAGAVPRVATVHDVVFRAHPELVRPALRDYLDRWTEVALGLAERVVTVSEFSRAEILRLYPEAEPERIRVIPNGVRPRARASREQQAELRRRLELPERFVLYLGSVEPKKNLEVVLEAARQADWTLVIGGGGGGQDDRLPERVAALGLRDRVRRLGYVPEADLPALLAAASVFVYPSRYEGFGLPPLEAMASDTPCVVSDASSLPEVTGEAALLADPDDGAAWAAAIGRLLEDADEAAARVAAGRERVRELSWGRCAAAHLALYEELV